MKKLWLFGLCCFVFMMHENVEVRAEEPALTLSSTISEYVSGNGFETKVSIKHMEDLSGLQVKLLYDASVYELTDHKRHNISVVYNTETPGEIIISYAYASIPANGDLDLITLSFNALSDPEIGLNRTLLEVDDTFNNEFIKKEEENTLVYVDAFYDFGGNRRYHLGDINKDDTISTMDINMMQLYLAEIIPLCDFGISAADLSGTGTLTMYDIIRVQEYVVGLNDSIVGLPSE